MKGGARSPKPCRPMRIHGGKSPSAIWQMFYGVSRRLARWFLRLIDVGRLGAFSSIVVIADPTGMGLLAFLAEFCGHFASPCFVSVRVRPH